MSSVILRTRRNLRRLLERSGWLAALALGLLLASALLHWPSWTVLVGGAVQGLCLLLLGLWVYRSRCDLAGGASMLLFPLVMLPINNALDLDASLWQVPQLLLSLLTVCAGLAFLLRVALQCKRHRR